MIEFIISVIALVASLLTATPEATEPIVVPESVAVTTTTVASADASPCMIVNIDWSSGSPIVTGKELVGFTSDDRPVAIKADVVGYFLVYAFYEDVTTMSADMDMFSVELSPEESTVEVCAP